MKIAVSSYSFNKMIQSGEITELDTISLAKEIGFDGTFSLECTPNGRLPEKTYESIASSHKVF